MIAIDTNAYEHKIGEYVVYKNHGICRVENIEKQIFNKQIGIFYLLTSVYDRHMRIFVPVDSDELVSRMRHILTADEVNKVIDDSVGIKPIWDDDRKQRLALYEQVLAEGDRLKILTVINTLKECKRQSEEEKRKFYIDDEKILAAAEKLIVEEFSFVLGINRCEVGDYIKSRVDK